VFLNASPSSSFSHSCGCSAARSWHSFWKSGAAVRNLIAWLPHASKSKLYPRLSYRRLHYGTWLTLALLAARSSAPPSGSQRSLHPGFPKPLCGKIGSRYASCACSGSRFLNRASPQTCQYPSRIREDSNQQQHRCGHQRRELCQDGPVLNSRPKREIESWRPVAVHLSLGEEGLQHISVVPLATAVL
jgi:hypothetical protein